MLTGWLPAAEGSSRYEVTGSSGTALRLRRPFTRISTGTVDPSNDRREVDWRIQLELLKQLAAGCRGPRRGRRAEGRMILRLAYRPPLDWEAMLEFLAGRCTAGVEQVEGGAYRRTVRSRPQPWLGVGDRRSGPACPSGRGLAFPPRVARAPWRSGCARSSTWTPTRLPWPRRSGATGSWPRRCAATPDFA